jgi:hypothetical protein
MEANIVTYHAYKWVGERRGRKEKEREEKKLIQ